jgi:hypothetical protein
VSASRTVTLTLINSNPIDITIEKYYSTLPHADIQLDYIRLIDGNVAKIIPKTNNISQVRLDE